MIIGIGSDLVDIRRINRTLERFGSRFVHRVFTCEEQAYADDKALRGAVYAKRFAAKEALWKALGEDSRRGIAWRELQVSNTPAGKPVMTVTGAAARRLAALTPPDMCPRIDLALTDEAPFAQAFVVISAETPAQHQARSSACRPAGIRS